MHNICSSHTASVWIRATIRICTLCWRFVGKVPSSWLQNYLFSWIIYCFFTSMLLGHHKSVNVIYSINVNVAFGERAKWEKLILKTECPFYKQNVDFGECSVKSRQKLRSVYMCNFHIQNEFNVSHAGNANIILYEILYILNLHTFVFVLQSL